MGLNTSGNHFCIKSDLALGDATKNKIVDDIMVEGRDVNYIYVHVHDVLLHCHEHGLVVSKKKFMMRTSVLFAGFVVSDEGVKPDPFMMESMPKRFVRVEIVFRHSQSVGEHVA